MRSFTYLMENKKKVIGQAKFKREEVGRIWRLTDLMHLNFAFHKQKEQAFELMNAE